MHTRRHVPATLVVLLLTAASPAWAVEIVVVPAAQPAAAADAVPPQPAGGASCGQRLRALWPARRFPICVCAERECRRPCGPGCLPPSGYYATRWRYLPSDDFLPPERGERGSATGNGPATGQPELLPSPDNNSQPSPRDKNGNGPSQNRFEMLPPPHKEGNPNNNNAGVTYLPVYLYYPVVPASRGAYGAVLPVGTPAR
jgi:hypothetical protein